MPGRTLNADSASVREIVNTAIPRILDQAQTSTANHQKNLVALYKVQTEAAEYTEAIRRGKEVRLVGERIFEEAILSMLMLVLPMKKGTLPADRIIKFISGYIKFVHEKGAAVDEQSDDDDDTTASRFTARLLKHLLKGFVAKDKSVRYRVVQTVAEMVSHLGEIDEEIYTDLRSTLLERVNDKETPVRVQAVIALSKLAGSEEATEVEDGEQSVSDVLMDILAHDSTAEVRRAVLLNIPVTPTTLPHILARTRDTDTSLRKLVYANVLVENVTQRGSMGPTHPRSLTIAQRELIVQNGLGDRELGVRTAAAALLGVWVDETKQEDESVESGVISLLHLFDLQETTVAAEALTSIFVTRPEIFDNLEFGDKYWTSLTPETAFLARVFVDHGKATKDDARLEAALPVVTALAFRLQESYNQLLEDTRTEEEERIVRDLSDEEKNKLEDARVDKEFIIGEILQMAVNLDYTDEIGRRKMFQLVRDMLSQEELPESLLSKCLDVLRQLSNNERDLIRVVVEIIHDLRDFEDEEEDLDLDKDVDAETTVGDTPATVRPSRSQIFSNKPAKEKTPEEKARADEIDMRCLILCIGMLERVNGTLEENSTLDGVLRDLIIPSVKRKELPYREKGIICLGLCCLIARKLALQSMQLFLGQAASSPEVLKLPILQAIFDMLMVHEHDFLRSDGGDNAEKIMEYLAKLIDSEESGKVKALLCMGISKLILSGMITDVEALKKLIKAYLSPHTVDNQELRQCLTFFFPVYCYSSPRNQRIMRQIFIDMYGELKKVRNDLEEGQEMISAAQVGTLFVDWTDPLKLSNADSRKNTDEKNQTDECIHLDMARDIFKALLEANDYDKDDKKVFCQLLSKLHIPDTVDDDKIKELKLLMHNLRLRRPPRDSTTKNAFTKFETAVCKKFEKQLEGFDEEEYKKLEQLQELFAFLDNIIPDDDDEVIDIDVKKKGRKRYSFYSSSF
ncbi:chromosome condensation complex protein [Collybia nuda]|uniref:Chromosome condensation complex protein n=1 Tax=Collybia nuda TaxID=64659 RepID=A0A9P5Y1H7_9AGAR|nr:chromosome condensation complex protein [Collybia nuda]